MRKLFIEWENEPLSALLHFLGFLLSVAGLVLLVVFASLKGSAWHVVSFSIFGAALVLLYAASTLYHFAPISSRSKAVFARLDHSMIYFLIAGTYTPICLITLRGAWGWSLFGVVWGLSIIGIILKSTGVKINGILSTGLYLLLGWAAVVAIVPLWNSLPLNALMFLVAGGVFYSLGTIAFAMEREAVHTKWFGAHEVFHIFVMLGSLSHFWLIFHYLL